MQNRGFEVELVSTILNTKNFTNTLDADGNYVKDQTKDLNLANAIPLQNPYPKVTGGFINNFKFHFVDFGFTFTYSLGGYSYDSGAGKLEKEGVTNSLDANIPIYYRDRWRKPGDESVYGTWQMDIPIQEGSTAQTISG